MLGPAVQRFEEEYAAFCGVGSCVGVGNGTDAIELALRGTGIGPGDEVVLPLDPVCGLRYVFFSAREPDNRRELPIGPPFK